MLRRWWSERGAGSKAPGAADLQERDLPLVVGRPEPTQGGHDTSGSAAWTCSAVTVLRLRERGGGERVVREQVHLARQPARRVEDRLQRRGLEERQLGAGEPEQMGEVAGAARRG